MTPEEIEQEAERYRKQLAAAAARLRSRLTRPATKEKLLDSPGCPRVLVRIFAGDTRPYFCVVEMEGLVPYRTTTPEERSIYGILSLDTPAVVARTPLELVERGSRVLQTAIYATPGFEWGGELQLTPGDLAMIHYRTTRAIRAALRMLGEDI